jgi:hypothetical protein
LESLDPFDAGSLRREPVERAVFRFYDFSCFLGPVGGRRGLVIVRVLPEGVTAPLRQRLSAMLG